MTGAATLDGLEVEATEAEIRERTDTAWQQIVADLERQQNPFYFSESFTFIDHFAGAGGASQGLTESGGILIQAANHWDRAIDTHSANFPDADHLMTDLLLYNMRRLPNADVYWGSPECTWHSPAGGRKRKRAMLDMFEEYVSDDAGERSRLTMMQVVAAAEAKRFKIVVVENVVEVAGWELFESWLHSMTALGYNHQILCVSAAHIWSPVNAPAPQWRDRVYFIFWQQGIEFPDMSPRPMAWCPACGDDVLAVQSWKRSDRRKIGKYRQQYVYTCPSTGHNRREVEPWVLPAKSAIDWSDLGTRIGDRKANGLKDLAPATERRIRVGARLFARPTVVAAHGQTWDAAEPKHPSFGKAGAYVRVQPADASPLNSRTGTPGDGLSIPPFVTSVNHDGHGRQYDPEEQPLSTRSTKIGDGIATAPFMVYNYDHNGGDERRIKPVDQDPLGTIVANGRHGQLVVPPYMVERRDYKGSDGPRVHGVDGEPLGTMTATGRGIHGLTIPPYIAELWGTSTARRTDDPMAAVTAGGNHHGLTVPPGAFIQKHHGGVNYARPEHMVKSPNEPLPAIVAAPNISLVIPYRKNGRPRAAGAEPLDTVATKAAHGLLTRELEGDFDISDYMFRMLQWREHASAQRFPLHYQFTGNKSENTMLAGNAVASNVAHYIGTGIRAALAGKAAA